MIRRIVRWAETETGTDDQGPYPTAQVGYLGRPGLSTALFPWGFYARPPKGVLAALFSFGAMSDMRGHMPLVGPERTRIALGEVIVYHPATGAKLHLKQDGSIEIIATAAATITAPDGLTINADTQINGTLDVSGAATLAGALTAQSTASMEGDVTLDTGVDLFFNGSEDGTPPTSLNNHVHRSDFATGPGDVDGPKDP